MATEALRPPAVEVDREAQTVYVNGEEAYLRTAEYRAFCLLWDRRGKLVTHREIADAAGEYTTERSWYLEHLAKSRSRSLVSRIRRVMGDAVDIRSRRGLGYRVEVPRNQASEWTRRAVAGGHEVWTR